MPGELATFELWWKGPDILWADPFVKPHQPVISSATAPEKKAIAQCHVCVAKKPLFLAGRYSNYHYWLKIAAGCIKYVRNHNAHPKSFGSILTSAQAHQSSIVVSHLPTLTVSDLKAAEHLLFIQSQSLHFEHEVKALQALKPVPSKSKIISLSPYLDPDGLLRVGGRLSRANLSQSQKHPIILCSQCDLVIDLFKYNLVNLGHCGPTLLLSSTGSRLELGEPDKSAGTV